MVQKYDSMLKEHLVKITVAKRSMVLNSLDVLLIHSTPYNAEHKGWELEREEVAQMKKNGVYEPVETKWVLSIVLVRKKEDVRRLFVDSRRLNAVTVENNYQITPCV